MTMIIYHESDHPRSRFSTIIHTLTDLVTRQRDSWSRRQTERMLEGLPTEIRKDIGWPTSNR